MNSKLVSVITCLLYNLRAHETVLDLVCRLLLEKNGFLAKGVYKYVEKSG